MLQGPTTKPSNILLQFKWQSGWAIERPRILLMVVTMPGILKEDVVLCSFWNSWPGQHEWPFEKLECWHMTTYTNLAVLSYNILSSLHICTQHWQWLFRCFMHDRLHLFFGLQMGGCPESSGTCNSTSCLGHEVDLMHFEVNKAIPGRLYGGNIFDSINGTGKDR
jgi:hypothetical protein